MHSFQYRNEEALSERTRKLEEFKSEVANYVKKELQEAECPAQYVDWVTDVVQHVAHHLVKYWELIKEYWAEGKTAELVLSETLRDTLMLEPFFYVPVKGAIDTINHFRATQSGPIYKDAIERKYLEYGCPDLYALAASSVLGCVTSNFKNSWIWEKLSRAHCGAYFLQFLISVQIVQK